MNTWASLLDKYGAEWLAAFIKLIKGKPDPTLEQWDALLGPAAKLDYQRAIIEAEDRATKPL